MRYNHYLSDVINNRCCYCDDFDCQLAKYSLKATFVYLLILVLVVGLTAFSYRYGWYRATAEMTSKYDFTEKEKPIIIKHNLSDAEVAQ